MSEVFSNIKVTPLKLENSNMRGSGTVTVANALEVRFTITDGKNGLWAKLPSHQFTAKNKESGETEKKWARDVKILDDQLYQQFQEMAIAAYNQALGSSGENQQRPARDSRNF